MGMAIRLWCCVLAILASGLAPVWLLSGPAAILSPPSVAVIDPVPIRRIPLDAEQLPLEMERVRTGMLVQLPRADFEERVRQAAQAQATQKQPPRLIEAFYRARLEGTALVGTGQWKIIHPGPAPAVLPLEPLNLFLRQPRFENRDALVGDLDGKGPGLLLDQTGPRTVALDWTARGDLGPDGLHFDLKTPACAVASLELTLPADRRVTVSPDGCLLSGPSPAENPDHRLWKVGFAGRSQLHVLIRQADLPNQPAPLVLATLKTLQEVTPDFLQAEYQFELQVPRDGVRELRCECDSTLRPYEVNLPGLESWELRAGKPGMSNTVLIKMREPLRGSGLLRVLCLAPLAEGKNQQSAGKQTALHPIAWKCPGMRVDHAVPRGETLVLRLHPDVRLDDWQPNGFRLADATVDANGWHVLTLTGGGIVPDEREKATPVQADLLEARPSARLQASGADYRARVVSWWQVRPGQDSLTAQITYEVLQGHLFQLPLLLPAGWDVERVDMSPSSLLRNWSVIAENGRSLLIVDLQQSLTTARSIPITDFVAAPPRLTLRLGPTVKRAHVPDLARGPREWLQRFPEILPVGARWPEGALAIEYDERAYEATLRTPLDPAPLEEEGPWGKQIPDRFYSYRGQPLTGTLLLRPRPPRLRVRCIQDVFPNGDRVVVETRVYLESDTGIPETLDLLASAPLGLKWSWRTESGGSVARAFERRTDLEAAALVGALGSHTPFEAVALLAAQLRCERWRLTLTQSQRPSEPITLHFTCDLPRANGDRWEVPLLTVLGVESAEGATTLHLPRSANVRVQTQGLSELRAGPHAPVSPPWRTFRHGLPPLSLTLFDPLPETSAMPSPLVRQAVLTTQVMPDHLLHAFRFQIENWREPNLPLTLPAGTRIASVRRDGQAIEAPATEVPGDVLTVSLHASEPPPADASPEPSLHYWEVIYQCPRAAAGFVWDRIAAPAPGLPIEPQVFQRVWRLPPGWQTLLDGRYVRLPGSPEDAGVRRTEWLATLPDRFTSFSTMPDWEVRQRQSLAEAAAGLAGGQSAKTLTLREVLERLAIDLLKDQGPLVLHTQALNEAGLGPDTPLPVAHASPGQAAPAPWESLGLVCIPCRTAPLMTTRRQREIWQTGAGGTTDMLDASVVDAVAEAAAIGRDGSSRFRTVADWLRRERLRPVGQRNGTSASEQSNRPGNLCTADLPPGWTEWEPIAGDHSNAELRVVRREAVTLTGLALAAALVGLLGLAWPLLGRLRLRLLLLWVAAGGLAVCWLPTALHGLAWWPWLAGLTVASVGYVRSALPIPTRVSAAVVPRAGCAATAAAVGLLALAGLGGRAAPAGPAESFTVFLVPGTADAPEKQTVLVPVELLDRLEALTHPTGGAPRGVVLLSAGYEGSAAEATADFAVVFQAHCFDERATLALPLAGVQLQDEVLLDGARAYPTALAAPQAGYTLPVEGRGPHTIRLRFRVPVQVQGDNRELQFSAPRLTQCRLAINLPPSASDPHVPNRVGEQRITTAADAVHLEADLGRITTPLIVRWRQESGPHRPPTVEVREGYLWDLGDDTNSLKAILQYSVTQGAAASFELDLPEPLEVRSIETGPPPRGKPVPRLKAWQVRGMERQRRLHLEFQHAVTGDVQVLLELVPRQAFGPTATLPLPNPRDAHPVQSYLAYGLDGVEARVKDSAHLTGPRVDEFLEFWRNAGEEDPRHLATAFAVTRKADAVPLLRLQMNVPAGPLSGTEDIGWRVGRHQADFQVTARLNAPAGNLTLVEWIMPPAVHVSHVSGRNIWHWSQSGSRLQVWFHQAVSAAEVRVAGWLPLDEGQKGPANARPLQFDLPGVRLVGAASLAATVRIAPTAGLHLTNPRTHNLWPLPESRGADTEHAYLVRDADYGASFQVRPADQPLDARVLTTAEVRDRQLTFVTAVECDAAQNDGRTLELRLDDWAGDDIRLEAANVARQREQRRGPSSHVWVLNLPPGTPNPFRLTLTMTRTMEEGTDGAIPIPRVSVVGAGRTEHWLAVHGPGIAPEASSHLSPVTGAGPASVDWQKAWPVEAERLRRQGGAAWKVLDNAPLRLTPRSGLAGSASVQVFLVEQSAAVADGRAWLHQATGWLFHRANTDLEITLPEGSTLVKAAIDGVTVIPLVAESNRVWLHLPEEAGACRVTLRWRFDTGDEPLTKPNLARPQFDGATEDEQLWTLHVPRGYRAEAATSSSSPELLAEQDLRRAEAQLRLSGVLAEQARGGGNVLGAQLLSAQQRFYAACRCAEQGLVGASEDSTAAIWLQTLHEQNKELAHAQGFEKTRADAERHARAGFSTDTENSGTPPDDSLPERGTPIYGQLRPGAAPPHLQIQSAGVVQARKALATSLVLLCILAAVGVLSYCPRVLGWVRRFWPEQLVLLAALLWLMDGPSLVVCVPLLVAITGRLLEFGVLGYRFWRRPESKTTVPLGPD